MQVAMLIVAIIAAIAAVANTIIALVRIYYLLRQRQTMTAEGVEAEKVNEMKVKTHRTIYISGFRMVAFIVVLVAVLGLRAKLFPPGPGPAVVPPTVYDFENDTQGWGEHPDNKLLVPGQGVKVYRDKQSPIRNTGECSLEFTPTEMMAKDAYVSVHRNAQEATITAYIFVPKMANINTSNTCSTARIIVWDKSEDSHESTLIKLYPGNWQQISWDLVGEEWPGPWLEFGIHFWLATDYKGPIYIDTVTLDR
ncbi:MAG: hypothetical protein JSU70_18765 [Phycisphaerales bacterium]|nr:MAG: hypothetical protein JSU70_18765 [Phycisphaerales bacterium]